MTHNIMLWANSSESNKVFLLQKKSIRIMADVQGVSYRELFQKFQILPLASEYLLELITFINNWKMFQTNSDVQR
jgi:hypothetical protein